MIRYHDFFFFLKWQPNCRADRSEAFHGLWASFAQCSAKMAVSDQVTEVWRRKRYSLRSIFQRNCVFWQQLYLLPLNAQWRHYARFRPEGDRIWPLNVHFDVPKAIRVTDPGQPKTYLQLVNGDLFGFLTSWGTISVTIFYIELFIVPLDPFQCQSGPLTQFAIKRFFWQGWRLLTGY